MPRSPLLEHVPLPVVAARARAADLYRDTLKALLGSVSPVTLRQRVGRKVEAAEKTADAGSRLAALRSAARLLRDQWEP